MTTAAAAVPFSFRSSVRVSTGGCVLVLYRSAFTAHAGYPATISKFFTATMTLKSLLLPLVFLVSLILEVQCTANCSFTPLSASNATIKNRISVSWMKTKKRNVLECSNWDNDRDELIEIFQLRFEKILHSSPALNISSSLFKNGSNGLNSSIFDELDKSVALLMEYNNLTSLNVTISQCSCSSISLKINTDNLTILPSNVFRELIDLSSIIWSENNFSKLPEDLFAHNRKLKLVELTDNRVNLTDLPLRLFNDFPDLEVVRLRSIGLQQLTEDLFWNSYMLKELDFSSNHLKDLPKNLLRDAHNLKWLSLSSNYLSTVPDGFFFATKQLRKLDLSNNYITALSSSDLFGLRSLGILYMKNNGLKLIHTDAFVSLSNLEIADFAYNHLNLSTGLYNKLDQISPFHHCPQLTGLYLSHNNISQMFSDWIMNCTELRKLDLSYNNFSYLEPKDLLFKAKLSVNLTHNFIKVVNLTQARELLPKNQDRHPNVQVFLDDNPIDCYCDVYPLVSYINERPIEDHEREYFTKAENLDYVQFNAYELRCNAPENVRGSLLLDAGELECSVKNGRSAICASGGACDCSINSSSGFMHLNCSGRNLTEAPAWIYQWNIRGAYVDLSGNALQRTPNMTKGGYQRVWKLDLSRNHIDRIEKENFYERRLHSLNLNHNKLTQVDWDIIRSMGIFTESIKMRDNPWICNDDILAFRNDLHDGLQIRNGGWDMAHFSCNKTSTTTTPTPDLRLPQMNKDFINKHIVVFIIIALFSLIILSALVFIIFRSMERKSHIRSFQKIKHDDEELSTQL